MSGKGYVVITGASTGIGRTCARVLDRQGFHVLAGVRKESDAESIRAESLERTTPVILDVTKPETIRETFGRAAEMAGDAGLAGLVNNAGIGVGAPMEFLSMDDLRRQFDVNVYGLVEVTQAAMPLIRKARGRIVHIGSASGLVSTPFAGPYCASKFAVEALTDSMRIELAPFGIHVSLVEPGRIKTPIWDRSLVEAERIRGTMPTAAIEYYGEFLDKIEGVLKKAKEAGSPPEHVAEKVLHALTSPRPRTRYVVGIDASVQIVMRRLLPDRAFDGIVLFLMKRGWV